MTYAFKDRPKINFSELDSKFWINDGDDVLWFESVLEAQDMARQLEIKRAADDARAELIRAIGMELALTAIANCEASSEWIDGFEFAGKRVFAVIKEVFDANKD